MEDPTLSVSMERLVQARGLELHFVEGVIVARCPFHDDGTDDGLRIDPGSNTWSCSTCNVTDGGPVEWLMRAEGISRTHAEELIRDGKFALERKQPGPRKGSVPKNSTVRTLGVSFTAADTDAVILKGVVSFYVDALKGSAEGHAFLDSKGLDQPRLIERFRLGFANKTIGLRIPKTNRVAGRQLRARLQDLGVLRRDTGHEHMTGCVVVPLFAMNGDIVNLYGKKIDRAQRGAPEELWSDPSKRGLINVEAFLSNELVVAGTVLDALATAGALPWGMGQEEGLTVQCRAVYAPRSRHA